MDEPPFWLDEYAWIRDFLGIEESEDRRALGILQTYFAHKPCLLPDLRKRFSGRVAIVIGTSESVLADLERLHHLRHLWEGKAFLVAADTATPLLLSRGMVPDIVVTDLDGPVEALVEALRAGSYIFVHGHGDNIRSLREVLPLLGERSSRPRRSPCPRDTSTTSEASPTATGHLRLGSPRRKGRRPPRHVPPLRRQPAIRYRQGS